MRIDYFEMTQRAKKKYAQLMEPICQSYGLTRNELDVLLFLHNNPEFDRAADVVAHRGMTKSHVSLSVTNLQNRGLLRGMPDPEDRRTVRLELQEEARRIAREGQEAQKRFFGRLFDGLSREDLAFWQKLTETVCGNIDAME